mmetsp:Transcript_35520/g.75837  ORF Transcript_35520/g.75837 Transcript_35520/m.75837 type:complete len:84 (+) Transcript_35520:12-263(+)
MIPDGKNPQQFCDNYGIGGKGLFTGGGAGPDPKFDESHPKVSVPDRTRLAQSSTRTLAEASQSPHNQTSPVNKGRELFKGSIA